MMIINIASIPATASLWSWIAKSPPKPMWSLSLDIITVIKSHLQLSWTATTAISKCHGCRLSSLLDLPVTGAGIKLQGFGYMFVCLFLSLGYVSISVAWVDGHFAATTISMVISFFCHSLLFVVAAARQAVDLEAVLYVFCYFKC